MLNLFNRSLMEVNNSETDTFDQAKTHDGIVISQNGVHAKSSKGNYDWNSTQAKIAMDGGKHSSTVLIDEGTHFMLGVAHKFQDKNERNNFLLPNSYCLHSNGYVIYDGDAHPYTSAFQSGPRSVEIVLDMELPSLRFKINGLDKGVAFNGDQLKQGDYFLTVGLYHSAVTILKSVHEVNN